MTGLCLPRGPWPQTVCFLYKRPEWFHPTLHYIVVLPVWCCTVLYCITLYCTVCQCSVVHCTIGQCSAVQCTVGQGSVANTTNDWSGFRHGNSLHWHGHNLYQIGLHCALQCAAQCTVYCSTLHIELCTAVRCTVHCVLQCAAQFTLDHCSTVHSTLHCSVVHCIVHCNSIEFTAHYFTQALFNL